MHYFRISEPVCVCVSLSLKIHLLFPLSEKLPLLLLSMLRQSHVSVSALSSRLDSLFNDVLSVTVNVLNKKKKALPF